MESLLVRMCIEAATESADAVEKWRRQRRTLERMPSHLDDALLRSLLGRRLLFPSLLDGVKIWLLAIMYLILGVPGAYMRYCKPTYLMSDAFFTLEKKYKQQDFI
ncbi:hypothetical protein OROHE_008671 [Orobanche hederae]